MRIHKPSLLIIDRITSLSYRKLFLLWTGLTLCFAIAYTGLSYVEGHGPVEFLIHQEISVLDGDLSNRFLNSLYYSTITATSTGYGDIVPRGFSKLLASIQSIFSLFIFAVFVTKLVSNRQEIALQEVHKLSFEDIFHNIREDLYLIRKDFDAIMEKAEEEKELIEDDWDNIITAYRQATSILQEIPSFYDNVNHLYTIDAKREELLQESVHRTVHRINQLLDTLSRHNIEWVAHEDSVSELRELVETIDHVTHVWKNRSPYEKQEAFEQILHLNESIHARMKRALPIQSDGEEHVTR